ncbi:hypothetical protein KIMH_06230 [Bombiscardovia apis]|uniref:Uncharacterized protein n=1 Tax=Bombiscardovia apis TaxID=2932182 RepID=A0ABN6SH18_9BIFI|nr:hypothetical protein [Bombiscardovia apis]BDR54512.1 hypothetical protein KIMH_06230 [Bombiscardovia apis]
MTNITITEFENQRVEFTSRLGNGIALWKGNEPQIGSHYPVELDIDDYFEWGINITLTKEEIPNISIIDNKLFFIAKIISYESDGILVISLDDDVIFLDVSMAPNQGKYVSFSTLIDNVSLYPVEF